MRRPLIFSFLVLLSLPAFAQKRAMTTDDYLNLVNLRSPMISPNGEFVIYGTATLNWDKNKYDTKYHYISSNGGDSYQYISEAGGSSLAFSPDGKYISLKRKAGDFTQIFLMPTSGGEAIQLTEHKNSIGSYKWSKDGKAIYFTSSVPKTSEEKKKFKDGYDQLFVDEAPNGQNEGAWNHIWKFDLESKKETKLTHGEMIVGNFDVSDNQERIIYTARFENRRNQGNKSEIFLLKIGDSTATKLTDNQAPENGLKWLPDNEHFLYMAVDDKKWELKAGKIWKMNTRTKEYEMISGAFNGTIRGFYLNPKGTTIYFGGIEKTNANLYSINLNSGKLTKHTDEIGTINILDFDKKREQVLFSKENATTPADLYVASLKNLGKPTRLTDLNPFVRDSLELADFEVISWKSYDGLEIEGIKYYPKNIKSDKSAPFLLHIHGGPAGVFRNSFNPKYHVFSGLGYVQLAPNVRGSSAYGDDFLRGNLNDIGNGDYEDLMSGVDMLIKDGSINPNKMAVRGWSYGGILGGTVITKTDRFKAASLGAMVSDWTSEYALGFNYDISLWYIGGTPWSNPEGYRERSPAMHATNVTTPTLFLHGANDRTDTPVQSQIFFTYLKDIGKVDTRYILFKREPHGFREPRNQRIRDIEEIKWIQKYTLGEDWQPWERTK